jgi:hypothetical protein
MPHYISFETMKFDPRAEPRNPINPIGGHSVLSWLREALVSEVTLSEPETEDWGWYATASFHGSNYLVGASSSGYQDDAPPTEWVIQIHKERSVLDKVLGNNRMAADDPLSAVIFAVVGSAPELEKVQLSIDGSAPMDEPAG